MPLREDDVATQFASKISNTHFSTCSPQSHSQFPSRSHATSTRLCLKYCGPRTFRLMSTIKRSLMRGETSTCAVACFTRTLKTSHLSHFLHEPSQDHYLYVLGILQISDHAALLSPIKTVMALTTSHRYGSRSSLGRFADDRKRWSPSRNTSKLVYEYN